MSYAQELRALFVLRPAPGRWRVAVQAAIAIGIPAVGFALAGHADLGLLASTGAFTALHLAARSRRERVRWLPFIGAGLVAATAIGVGASGNYVVSVVALFLVAVAASVLTLGWSMGPPGGMFFVLAAGVGTRLAAPAALGGDGLPGGLVIGMVVVGAVIAYLVVLAPLVLPSVRRGDALLHAELPRRGFSVRGSTGVILARITIAAAVGSIVAAPLGVHRVYWVLVAVVVILQNGHQLRLSATRAVHRVLGTLVGVGLLALVLLWNPHELALALLLVVLQFVVEMVVVRNYGLALIFITPLALLIAVQGTTTDVAQVVSERIVDTLLGGGIALLVLFVAWVVHRVRAPA